jgi:hypothetical protein
MSAPDVYCGQALCKARVTIVNLRWPARCDRCGATLYPSDVLDRLPASELEPERAELMTERRGVRVAITSAELAKSSPRPEQKDEDDAADRILAMIELDPAGAAARKARRSKWIAAAVGLALLGVAAAVGFLVTR